MEEEAAKLEAAMKVPVHGGHDMQKPLMERREKLEESIRRHRREVEMLDRDLRRIEEQMDRTRGSEEGSR